MDLRNSFDALDPRNPGFIGLESESEIDSVSDDRRDDVYSECHATSCSIAVEFEGEINALVEAPMLGGLPSSRLLQRDLIEKFQRNML